MAVAFPAFAAVGSMPSIREIVWDVILVLGVGLIFGLLHYLVSVTPFISAPIKQVLQWALVLVAILLIIYVILGFLGL